MRFLTLVLLLSALCVHAKTAEEVWSDLIGKNSQGREAYAFVKENRSLANVFIYGDSISIAYTPAVRAELAKVANVYRLHVNGGDSSSVIDKMETLHKAMRGHAVEGRWNFTWDVIQFNAGLHDLKYIKDGKLDKVNGKQVSSLKEYESNLRAVIAYLKKLAPEATLIFATTTPVPEDEPGRHAGDAKRFNDVALKVLKDFPEIVVNDLYGFTRPHHADWWTKPGNVHYNPMGIEAQGNKSALVILRELYKKK